MGKKRGITPIEPSDLQIIHTQLSELVGKVRAIDTRVRNLITFSEYIAGNLDLTISYTDFLADTISRDRYNQQIKSSYLVPSDRIPTFDQFKKIQIEEQDSEIPF